MLSDQGVIAAEPDGKFLPSEPVTRAVFAYWLVKVLGLDGQPVSPKPSFPDVKPTDWCYKPIEIIRQNNYISGYADGFRPNQFIQKAEVIQIIARSLNATLPDKAAIEKALASYKDKNKIPEWAKAATAQCSIAGILIGPNAAMLEPTKIISRGDTAALLCNLNRYVTHQSINETTVEATDANNVIGSPPQSSMPPAPGVAPPYAPAISGYPPQGYPPNGYQPAPYQGRVLQQGQGGYPQYQPAPYQQPAYLPQNYAAPPGAGYMTPQPGYPQPGYPLSGNYPPPAPYAMAPPAGMVIVIAVGTHFQAALKTSIDSGTTQPGAVVEAVLNAPLVNSGREVVPAASKITGTASKVVSAKSLKLAENGKIELKFTVLETPDGRKFNLNAASLISTAYDATKGAAKGTEVKKLPGSYVPITLEEPLPIPVTAPMPMPLGRPGYPPQYGGPSGGH